MVFQMTSRLQTQRIFVASSATRDTDMAADLHFRQNPTVLTFSLSVHFGPILSLKHYKGSDLKPEKTFNSI